MTDFERIIGALAAERVRLIVVGGLAATAHGAARLTQDVDLVYSRSPENVERLVRALAPFRPYLRGAPAGLPFEWSRATIERGLNFTLTTSIGDLDLPWLIRVKRAAGRPKDLEAIAELEAILEEQESIGDAGM